MASQAAELARRLARDAEAVCRCYLSNGRREGRYWLAGDVRNTPGRSLFVRLHGPVSGKGAAGRWTDAATAEHGDLLDLIALNRGLDLRGALDEARAFLRLPRPAPPQNSRPTTLAYATQAARRLFAMSQPVTGTLAAAYLREPRHCCAARGRQPPLPPTLLLSAGRARAGRDVAGHDRRGH